VKAAGKKRASARARGAVGGWMQHTHTHTHTHTYTLRSLHTHAHTHAHADVNTHIHTHLHTHIHTPTRTHSGSGKENRKENLDEGDEGDEKEAGNYVAYLLTLSWCFDPVHTSYLYQTSLSPPLPPTL
jgi:hypothetical protein